MTATEILRRLLDERGVEWWNETDPEPQNVTMARAGGQLIAYHENANGSIGYHICNTHDLTPEQAIAATLGTGTCRDVADTPQYRDKTRFECSECGYEYSAVGGFGCDYGDEPDFNYCPNCGRKVVDE